MCFGLWTTQTDPHRKKRYAKLQLHENSGLLIHNPPDQFSASPRICACGKRSIEAPAGGLVGGPVGGPVGGQRLGPIWVQYGPNRVKNQGTRRRTNLSWPIT